MTNGCDFNLIFQKGKENLGVVVNSLNLQHRFIFALSHGESEKKFFMKATFCTELPLKVLDQPTLATLAPALWKQSASQILALLTL